MGHDRWQAATKIERANCFLTKLRYWLPSFFLGFPGATNSFASASVHAVQSENDVVKETQDERACAPRKSMIAFSDASG
jgi:hypothetical protein